MSLNELVRGKRRDRRCMNRGVILTSRETDVLRLIAEGMSNKEIAACLMVSRDTVQVHTRSLFVKLGVHDRTSAVRVGAARGIVRLVQG